MSTTDKNCVICLDTIIDKYKTSNKCSCKVFYHDDEFNKN